MKASIVKARLVRSVKVAQRSHARALRRSLEAQIAMDAAVWELTISQERLRAWEAINKGNKAK